MRSALKQQLLEVEDAWATLDGYAVHSAGCPTVWGQSAGCNCNLSAVRARLRKAVLDLLTTYGIHDAECPAVLGNRCDCGLDSARRRLRRLVHTPPPERKGEGLSPTDRHVAQAQTAFGVSLLRQARQRVSGLAPATEGQHADAALADAANETLEGVRARIAALPDDQQLDALTMIAYGMIMEHLRLASWTPRAA